MSLPFRRDVLTARFSSSDGSSTEERRVGVRWDPLLGTTARIAEGVRLPSADPDALTPLGETAACPFCRSEEETPRLLPEIVPEGRIRAGETLLFPNLVPYSQYAAVAIFSARHWLDLPDFTPGLLADNLTAAQEYVRRVCRYDPRVTAAAYNINYLYPSGGSLPHPHSQIYLDPHPTTMTRLLQEAGGQYLNQYGRSYWDDLIAEEAGGERFVGEIGGTVWLTPFAPLGFNEVRAIVRGRENLLDLTPEEVNDLATGTARVLASYEAGGYNSFNLGLYSGDLSGAAGFRLHLAIITRSALLPYYRSDAMYLERLHWEAAVDRTPEEVAAWVRPFLSPSTG